MFFIYSKLRMENSMNAILSIIMIGVGFVNGMGWSNLFKLQQINELQHQLYAEKSLNDSYQELVEELEDKNKRLEEKLEAIKSLATLSNNLPPPNTPLLRSQPVLRSSSNTSDLSPIASNNKD